MRQQESVPLFISILIETSVQNQCIYSGKTPPLTLSLLNELSEQETLNYYPRNSPSAHLYPDDIDDTFSGLYLLARYNKDQITPPLLSKILFSLNQIRSEENPVLFNTWYTTDMERFKSHDIVALSAIVAFFDSINSPGEDLKEYIVDEYVKKIKRGVTETFSEFYHSKNLPLYLLSRISFNKNQYERLFNTLLNIEIDTNNLLIRCSIQQMLFKYLNIYPPNKTTSTLLELIKENSIEPKTLDPLYIEQIKDGVIIYAHSREFIEQLCAEAIAGKNAILELEIKSTLMTSDSLIEIVAINILKSILTECSLHIQTTITNIIHELAESDDFKIVRDICYLDPGKRIDLLPIHLIGLLGYFLYDKITDQGMESSLLPICIFSIRKYLNEVKGTAIEEILDTTDIHFNIEVQKADFPIINVSNKSIGVAAIPILLFEDHKDALIPFFKYFQAARQICDDLADNQSDLEKNKFTTMRFFGSPHIDYEMIEKNLSLCMQEIKHILKENNELNKVLSKYSDLLSRKISKLFFEHKVLLCMLEDK